MINPVRACAATISVTLLVAGAGDFARAQTWLSKGHAPATSGQVEGIVDNPVAGAIEAVVAHPSNADIIWVGAVNGGVFRTDNGTAASPTWTPQTDDQASLSIGALELDPTDATHNTLVAGTARTSNYGNTGGARIGILRTTNGGTSWTAPSTGLSGKNISGVAPRGATIVVSVDEADVFAAANIGIFRSTDSGVTFTQVAGVMAAGVSAYDLVGDPTDSTRLYTIVRDRVGSPANSGIYRSDDTGATWAKISNASQDGLINTSEFAANLAVGKAGPAAPNVFVAICTGGALVGVQRTGNGSVAAPVWTVLDVPSPTIHPGTQCARNLSFAADPTLHNVVYIGGDRQDNPSGFPNDVGALNYTGRLFRIDAGQASGSQATPITHCKTAGPVTCKGSQRTTNNSAPHADSRDMVFDANGDLIEVDDGGVYKHTDPSGTTGDWMSLNGDVSVNEQHNVAYDAVSNIVFSGNQDVGSTRQVTKASVAWTTLNQGDGGDVVVGENDPIAGQSTRYHSAQSFGSRSRRVFDAANVQQSMAAPMLTPLGGDPAPSFQFTTPLGMNNVAPMRLILGGSNGTYESSDRLDSVRRLSTAVVNSFVGGGYIAYGASGNADALYFASGDKVYVRTAAWPSAPVATDPDLADFDLINGVAIDPGFAARAFAVDSNQVFTTINSGTSWSDITGNLQSFDPGTLRSVEYIPGGAPIRLVVGTNTGVYSADAGSGFTTWSKLGTGLPNTLVYELDYNAGDNVLTAGTLGRGAWTLSNPVCSTGSGSFTASDENELASAIRCYNSAGVSTTTTVTLTGDITLTSNVPDIDGGLGSNKPKLVVEGGGFTLDAAGNSDPFHILAGDVTINDMTITGSNDDGIQLDNGTLVVTDSTITGNNWGIYFRDVGVSFSYITVTNSTIAGNSNDGFLQTTATGTSAFQFKNSTITDNGDRGIQATITGVTLTGTLIARNGGADCSGTIVDGGGNKVEDASCGTIPATAGLGATLASGLADNGCALCTQTIALLTGSPAIDAAGTCGLSVDQRGFARPAGSCDAGAFELACSTTVSASDEASLAFGIGCYNGETSGTTTVTLSGPVTLSAGLPLIDNATTATLILQGDGHSIDAGGTRPFQINDGNVEIHRVTISNSNTSYSAIDIDGGALLLKESTLTGNGTGVNVDGATTDVRVTNSTLSFNRRGVFVATGVTIEPAITNSTITDNVEQGIWTSSATLLTASLVFRNGQSCLLQFPDGSITDGGGNAVGYGPCDSIAAMPTLFSGVGKSLASNGCTAPCTQTIALLNGSPAIDAAGTCGPGTDQRGVVRPSGACDSGAFELVPGVCGNSVVEEGELCDDGNTASGDCCSSICLFESSGSACSDGSACTSGDTCDGAGTCDAGGPLNCNDANVCTNDSCNPATGCEYINNSVSCNDGSLCTVGDTCAGGACVGGPPPNCNDGNTCTDNSCNPATGCVATNNTAPCEDGSLCTTGDSCSGGSCQAGSPTVCDDGNECTDDSCDPGTGCATTNNTASCDDDLYCTTDDTCDGGVCNGLPRDCDDGDVCTSDECMESLNICFSTAQDILDLDFQTITEDEEFEASTSISAGSDFVVDSPAVVSFDAPSIILSPSFSVNSGASFRATNLLLCVEQTPCAQSVCLQGVALDPACDPCVAAICAQDPFCCNATSGAWDNLCVDAVPVICELTCN